MSLGNCVTVARQTLTLFVGVRIPIPQPKRKLADLNSEFFIFEYNIFTNNKFINSGMNS